MKKTYYGGYFGTIAGVINPCHPYWQKNGYFEREESQYEAYLWCMYDFFSSAAKAAYEQKGYTTFERRKCVRKGDYEALQATADYYYERYLKAGK